MTKTKKAQNPPKTPTREQAWQLIAQTLSAMSDCPALAAYKRKAKP